MEGSLLSTPMTPTHSDVILGRARRLAVMLALAGGATLTVLSIAQIATSDPSGLITLGAALPTTLAAAWARRQEDPPVIGLLFAIAVIAMLAEFVAALRGDRPFVQGSGSEFVAFGLGILSVFVAPRSQARVARAMASVTIAIVLISGISLGSPPFEIATDVAVTTAVMAALMVLVIRVQQSLTISRSRYIDLAGVIPVVAFELDTSQVIASMARLREAGVTELKSAMIEDKGLMGSLAASMRLTYYNRQAIEVTRTLGGWTALFTGPNEAAMFAAVRNVYGGLWSGADGGTGEIVLVDTAGNTVSLLYQWVVGRIDGRKDPTRVVVTGTDVSKLRSAEAALEAQLRQRDQFVASVSHELRTPLTAVMGFTNELVERPADFSADEQAEMLGMILGQVEDVTSIVEDLLITARAEAGNVAVSPEPVSLDEEAARVADALGGIDVHGDQAIVLADPARLRQIIRNLVTNAERHGGAKRRMVVVAGAQQARLEVRDDGHPLDDADRERIFEPYKRSTRGAVAGSVGLGLHVARVLARIMGGDLTYEHDGREAVFCLELPRLEAEVAAAG